MKIAFHDLRRYFLLLRSRQHDGIAAFVNDPLKVRKEVRFLILRLIILSGIAFIIIGASMLFIGRLVRGIEEKRLLLQKIYTRFESMAALSHDVNEGRAALAHVEHFAPEEENLLLFLERIATFARDTGNKSTFHFDQSTSSSSGTIPDYRFIAFTITLTGDTRSFLRYLENFYTLPYPLTLSSVLLESDQGLSAAGARMQISGRVYVQ